MTMTTKGKLTGIHVLIMLCLFFGVMIVVNVIFTVFAVKTFPGEQEKKSYLQGLHYNQTIEERERESQLGWNVQAGFEMAGATPSLVTIWSDKSNQQLVQLDVLATLTRPASEDGQLAVTLLADGPGRYLVALPDLQPGNWHVEITATNADGDHLTARKVMSWAR